MAKGKTEKKPQEEPGGSGQDRPVRKITAPNRRYNGVTATVAFREGVGETDSPALLEWFASHGYTVEPSQENREEQEEQEHDGQPEGEGGGETEGEAAGNAPGGA